MYPLSSPFFSRHSSVNQESNDVIQCITLGEVYDTRKADSSMIFVLHLFLFVLSHSPTLVNVEFLKYGFFCEPCPDT